MKKLARKRRLARNRKLTRHSLVHAAGCVVENCIGTWPDVIAELIADAEKYGINIPRSLRNHTIKVYLDDEREGPEGWVRTRWPDDVIELLKTRRVTHLSLDHDLGDDDRGTGYDVIKWLEVEVALRGFRPPEIYVHSANSSARHKMELGINSIKRFWGKNR